MLLTSQKPPIPAADRRRSPRRAAAMVAAWLLLAALATLVPAASGAAATTLTVNSVDDRGDTAPGDGTCLTSSGTCSLRAAIEESNALAGPDTIRFAIAGNGPHTIDIGQTLTLRDRSGGTTIDGYTQPGATPNSHAHRSNAQIKVEITTNDVLWPMLLVTSPGNTIRGLAIHGNGPRIELRGEDADGNRILGNFIGTDAAARATSGTPGTPVELARADAGIALNLGPDRNLIGSADPADRNVIVANNRNGIRINHGETSQNTIENNIIGLGPSLEEVGPQTIGVDIQWWTWGNYVTGNLISGHRSQAVDLSHSAVGNAVIGNHIGTLGGGDSANNDSINKWGVTFKDNAVNNYVADNVIGNSSDAAIWHKHNYTGANTVVNNRIGVGADGAVLENTGAGIHLRGHDDLYLDNIIANSGGGVFITDTTASPGPHTNFPSEKTLGNRFHQNTFYRNGDDPAIDIENTGPNGNDPGDGDDGAHLLLNHPEVTGIGPGEVYGRVCDGCTVEVFVSGDISGDGTLDTSTGARGTGLGWIGRVTATGDGRWSLAHPHIVAGKDLTTVTVDAAGNTSETSPTSRVPSTKQGDGDNAGTSLARLAVPPAPARPPAWVPDTFTCSWSGGVLSWEDEGAAEYYVRTVDAAGDETYLGGRTGTSTPVPNAAGYRVVNWSRGYARSAVCDGPGDGGGQPAFSCSYADGALSWTDQGVSTYYVRLVNGGSDSYFGSSSGTSLSVPAADEYLVVHWSGGRNEARCGGPGPQPAFSCSYADGALSWTDQGVSTYYVRLVNGGSDVYFGSSSGTSLSVPAAEGYMVVHWVGGRNAAVCPGPG